MYAETLQRLI